MESRVEQWQEMMEPAVHAGEMPRQRDRPSLDLLQLAPLPNLVPHQQLVLAPAISTTRTVTGGTMLDLGSLLFSDCARRPQVRRDLADICVSAVGPKSMTAKLQPRFVCVDIQTYIRSKENKY